MTKRCGCADLLMSRDHGVTEGSSGHVSIYWV